MKVERYITEFANAKWKQIEANDQMNPGVKKELLRRIDRAIFNRSRGYITADEAIMIIGHFEIRDEDFSEYMEEVET